MSDAVIAALRVGSRAPLVGLAPPADEPLTGDDCHLALHCCYGLSFDGFSGVDDRWEWEPALLRLRRRLEDRFLDALRSEQHPPAPPSADETPSALRRLIAAGAGGPSLSRYVEERASLDQLREVLVHRSIYQRKEADAHTFAIPRLRGAAKSAMVAIQADEYGAGQPGRTHAELFAVAMAALDLDPTPGAYVDTVPGVTLATDNLSSLFGLHRKLRGALVGHLAVFEMTSVLPMSRYAAAVRRVGGGDAAAEFYDVHVDADAEHEVVAARDLAGGFVRNEPALAGDVLFGAEALMSVEARLAAHILGAWEAGRSSLRPSGPDAVLPDAAAG
ncbi:MAG TPA: iron-containing redox enzyme family protein [Acidimicrobiales bacterium]|nr:iron-containing redox enzyme family protein [Acidimicrobiales bacterium]